MSAEPMRPAAFNRGRAETDVIRLNLAADAGHIHELAQAYAPCSVQHGQTVSSQRAILVHKRNNVADRSSATKSR